MDGQKLDGCHAQGLQIGDLFDQPGKGARMLDARRPMKGEASNMQLVNDRILKRNARGLVVPPIEGSTIEDAAPRGPVLIGLDMFAPNGAVGDLRSRGIEQND